MTSQDELLKQIISIRNHDSAYYGAAATHLDDLLWNAGVREGRKEIVSKFLRFHGFIKKVPKWATAGILTIQAPSEMQLGSVGLTRRQKQFLKEAGVIL